MISTRPGHARLRLVADAKKPDRARPPEPVAEKLLAEWEAHLKMQHNLCCMLEKLADDLPGNIDRQECLNIARSIDPVIRQAHEFEEKVIFPLLRAHRRAADELDAMLERLRGEHCEDEDFGCELRDQLLAFAKSPEASNPEALGYMLRGFFEGLRRHIAFEREHVLPILAGSAGQ